MAKKPAIVQAKENASAIPPSGLVGLASKLQNASVEDVIKMKKYSVGGVLKEMGDIDGSSFNRELLNTDIMAGKNVQAKVKNAQMTGLDQAFSQAGDKGATGMKEFQMTRDENAPGIRFDEMLQTLYKNADRNGVNSGQQFLTSFDGLLNSAKPEDKAFLQKYGGPDASSAPIKIEKFKRAAAEQYQRLLNEKNKISGGQGATNQTPPTTTMPNTASVTKLKVTKTA